MTIGILVCGIGIAFVFGLVCGEDLDRARWRARTQGGIPFEIDGVVYRAAPEPSRDAEPDFEQFGDAVWRYLARPGVEAEAKREFVARTLSALRQMKELAGI